MTKPKAKPVEAEAVPPAYEPEKTLYKDPGRRCDPRKIDAAIERIFNDGPRLGAPALAATEAA
jgi:hypothetical protein